MLQKRKCGTSKMKQLIIDSSSAADNLINTNMQGGNTNTMGDIVYGVLGALTYFTVAFAA